MTTSQVAISYARFSSKRQAKGHSLKRQLEAVEKYAAEHGLVIDTSLSAVDLGFSAYNQANVRKGALGGLLKAIEQGKVPVGATLIIEGFDRLSRASPLDALAVFTDILNAGLNIVTLTDKMVFSRELIKEQPMLLFASIMVMQRAYNESLEKGKKVRKAWNDKQAKVADGHVLTTKTPMWIKVVGEGKQRSMELIEDRAALARELVDLSLNGNADQYLTRMLNARGTPAWASKDWTPAVMHRLLGNRALYGAITLPAGVQETYYPAVIDKATYLLLQEARAGRLRGKSSNRKGSHLTNLFSGKLYCAYCGRKMNVIGQRILTGSNETRKYIACSGARSGATECKKVYWALDELEAKLLIRLIEVDHQSLFGTVQGDISAQQKAAAEARGRLILVKEQVGNITNHLRDTKSKALLAELTRLEAEQELLEQDAVRQETALGAMQAHANSSQARMDALLKTFEAMKTGLRTAKSTGDHLPLRAVRERLASAVDSVLERVTLYTTGPSANGDKSERYLLATLKSGKTYEIDDADDNNDSTHINADELKQVLDEGNSGD